MKRMYLEYKTIKNLLINLLQALTLKDDDALNNCLQVTDPISIRNAVSQLQLSQFEQLFGPLIKKQ